MLKRGSEGESSGYLVSSLATSPNSIECPGLPVATFAQGRFPYIVALQRLSASGDLVFACTGTLIGELIHMIELSHSLLAHYFAT